MVLVLEQIMAVVVVVVTGYQQYLALTAFVVDLDVGMKMKMKTMTMLLEPDLAQHNISTSLSVLLYLNQTNQILLNLFQCF